MAVVGAVSISGVGAASAVPDEQAPAIVYRAAAGETNVVRLAVEGDDLLITDMGAKRLPRSLPATCVSFTTETGVGARCSAPGDILVRVELGDGDDSLVGWQVDFFPRLSLDVSAGPGDDVVESGDGNDRIRGGPGFDTLYGGWGDDVIISQGDGWLHGNEGDDVINGGGFVFGDNGNDRVTGGANFDFIYGGNGRDIIDAGGDADYVSGDGGDDVLRGGPGDDTLHGGGGADIIEGGTGDDELLGQDGVRDELSCGAGVADVVKIDAGMDWTDRACEKVVRTS